MGYVSTIISGVASLGVLIGLISGIFFLVLTGLKWISRVRASLYDEELRRQKRFLINNSYLVDSSTSSFLETRKVKNDWESELNGKISEDPQSDGKNTAECNSSEPDGSSKDPNFSTVKVREMIEKMVETIIGGTLDGTTVGQMSTHSAWKNGFDIDSADLKQSNLRRLIKRIVSEAMALPNIKEILSGQKTSKETETDDFKNKSYEDILATAILNKIIENFQNKIHNGNETDGFNTKRHLKHRKIKTNEDEYKSDCDWSDTSRSDQLSLTIEEYIEEVTTALNASEDDRSDLSDFETSSNRRIPFPESGRTVVDGGTDDENSDPEEQNTATELITSTSSWEENWLFQKKRLRSTPNAHHPVPVPMLVPNPSEEFRALVGGVDADDLSDMSDCSDSILEDMITTEEPTPQMLSKDYAKKEIKEELLQTEIQTEGKISSEDKKETLNERVLKDENTETAFADEKWREHETTEEVLENSVGTVLPEVLSQKDRDSSIESIEDQFELIDSHHLEGAIENSAETEAEDTLICRIAEREKEKWKNPVPWTHNPYSLENIQNKEQRKKNEYFRIGTYTGESIDFPDDSSSSEISKPETEKLRFSRDYYVNASKQPSGMISPSLSQSSKENEQKFENSKVALVEYQDKFATHEMQENTNKEPSKHLNIDKSQFCLPSVKELAKQFTTQDSKEPKRQNSKVQTKLESKHNNQYHKKNAFPEKKPEINCSKLPVSEIIQNLQQAAETPVRENHKKNIMCNITLPSTRMEVCRKIDNNLVIEKYTENAKVPETVRNRSETLKFNGKQVHSLTARSISKEFRDGLKNSSYQKYFPKIDRISSGGESDQGEVVCSRPRTSPEPTIDLKNMKKFWEEIITANSNSTKQK